MSYYYLNGIFANHTGHPNDQYYDLDSTLFLSIFLFTFQEKVNASYSSEISSSNISLFVI